MKAIETKYNGYRFRSRTEARWAVFMDSAKIPYEYEKQGYELPSGRYLPDFWLPIAECFLEIKGDKLTIEDARKVIELSNFTKYPVLAAVGTPEQEDFGFAGVFGAEEKIALHLHDDYSVAMFLRALRTKPIVGLLQEYLSCDAPKMHFNAARSARFEFGENGR